MEKYPLFYQQPPVGNPVHLSKTAQYDEWIYSVFSPYSHCYYDSGTSSLAAAIIAAIKFKDIDQPEVILPAYGCPDLISAVVFAGAKPVLVDLEQDRPWFDLEKLARRIGEQTVGVVAVDLLGIPESYAALRTLADRVDALLIEDSAQAFPASGESNIWHGDLVVVSFGRGKPLSLLGGGAVLHQGQPFADLLPEPEELAVSRWRDRAKYRVKVFLYNRMLSPRLYWIPQGLPFLHLGETHYHPLTELGAMNPAQQALLAANLAAYQAQTGNFHSFYSNMFDELGFDGNSLIDLPRTTNTPTDLRLLRYPLLVAPEIRDYLYQALRRAGLGPSLMYPTVLPEIHGLEELLGNQGDFPQARSFAERILTLPTHNGICERDLAGIRQILARYFAE